jgi:hypothetical protein
MSDDTPDISGLISDELAEEAGRALSSWPMTEYDAIDAGCEVLQAVGPKLIAAELRRLADAQAGRGPGLPEEHSAVSVASLRRRADELDPR